jgi:hypothetical protein
MDGPIPNPHSGTGMNMTFAEEGHAFGFMSDRILSEARNSTLKLQMAFVKPAITGPNG